MRTCARWGVVAAVLALMPTLAAGVPALMGGRREARLPKRGIVPLDLQVGPVLVYEVLIQDAPSDPEAILALPADKPVEPKAVLVIANHGERTAGIFMTVTFLDGKDVALMTCTRGEVSQDENTDNEIYDACARSSTHLMPAQWANVKTIRVDIQARTK